MKRKRMIALLLAALLCLAAASAGAVTVTDVNGRQADMNNYVNRDAIVVFGKLEDYSTQVFLRGIMPSVPILQQYGISVVAVMKDAETKEELAELTRTYPGIVFLHSMDPDPEDRYIIDIGYSGMYSDPEVFIRSAAGELLWFTCWDREYPGDTAAKAIQRLKGVTVEPVYPMYRLTVNLLRVDDEAPLAPPIIREYRKGDEYRIDAPEIAGYTPQGTAVRGVMPEEHQTVTIHYEETVTPFPKEHEVFVVTDKDTVCLDETFSFRFFTKYVAPGGEPKVWYTITVYRGEESEIVDWTIAWTGWEGEGTYTLKDSTIDRIEVKAAAIARGDAKTGKAVVTVDKNRVYDPKEKIRDFVRRCYRLILGRDVDEQGLNGWSEALANGTAAAAQIIDGIVNSQEYMNRNLSKDNSVRILYKAMLDREPDADGLHAWTRVLNQGHPFAAVINGFCDSDEFRSICEEYGIRPGSVTVGPVNPEPAPDTPRGKIEAFVKRCYKLILNRDADQGGLQGWSDALETGTGQACQIIDGFVRSPEYVNRNLGYAESVDILYRTMLNRAADEGGKAGWVDALEKGYTLQHIINGFCGSAEFTNICNEFGITAGNLLVQGVIVKREAIAPEGEEEAPVVYVNYTSEYTDGEKIRAFVEHCYEAVFGREGDAEGVEAYKRLILDGKKTPKRVAYEFIFSDEFQNRLPGNEAFIRILYRLYLNREPNADELAGWVATLENGASLEEIVNSFAASEEFRTILQRMK